MSILRKIGWVAAIVGGYYFVKSICCILKEKRVIKKAPPKLEVLEGGKQ